MRWAIVNPIPVPGKSISAPNLAKARNCLFCVQPDFLVLNAEYRRLVARLLKDRNLPASTQRLIEEIKERSRMGADKARLI